MAEKKPEPKTSPYCAELRSKRWLSLQRPPLVEEDILDVTGHVWCAESMQSLGPDGEIVDPADCQAGRKCFRRLDGGR